jgi:hypothetical protein
MEPNGTATCDGSNKAFLVERDSLRKEQLLKTLPLLEGRQVPHSRVARARLFFLHYWGTGSADKLATGFKAALAELGRGQTAANH